MSDKLPAVKPQRLIRVLEAKGWQHRRTRGSHHYMIHPERRDAIAVPVHNRDVKPGLLLTSNGADATSLPSPALTRRCASPHDCGSPSACSKT